ncbi:SDR family oxidoreductase [Spirillospora sp. CA-253888]
MGSLDGPVSVVTGASRGIGAAVATALGRAGGTVVITYRQDSAAAERVAQDVQAAGGRALTCAYDLEEPDSATRLFDFALSNCGRVDHFVANAAAGPVKPVSMLRAHHLDRARAANSRAFFLSARHAAGHMGDGGRIVALSSVGARFALPGYAVIGMEKAAIEAWVRSLAVEYAPRGITVNSVQGGLVDTRSLAHCLERNDASMAQAARHIPAGRVGTAQEIADVAVFLLSPNASYLTGQNVVVDGGLSIFHPVFGAGAPEGTASGDPGAGS